MKRLNYLIGLSILVAFILAMVAIVPASADKPERYRFPNGGDGTVTVCGDTEFTWHQEFVQQGNLSCDPDSGLCKLNEQVVHETFTITNPNNGRTLDLHGGSHTKGTQISSNEFIWEITGGRFKITIPGYGPVFGSPGRYVYYEICEGDDPETWVCQQETLFDSGPTFDDFEAICNYMVGE